MRLAAVDVGTNTVRLIVVEDGETLERAQRITRLGRGVDATRTLAPDSISATRQAVETFVGRARQLGAERIRVAGTSALRDATNASEFAAAVSEATGLDLEVLDGRTEGRLAYAGGTSWLPSGSYVVCDIGGGSTELIGVVGQISVDVGSVRLRERHLRSDPPEPDELDAARREIRGAIGSEVGRLGLSASEQLVGVAGTITTLAALVLGLETYSDELVHASRMSVDDVAAWSKRLNAMSTGEIRALGVVEPGRADVLGSGALVLEEVMRLIGSRDVLVSVRDILDGLVLDLAERLA